MIPKHNRQLSSVNVTFRLPVGMYNQVVDLALAQGHTALAPTMRDIVRVGLRAWGRAQAKSDTVALTRTKRKETIR
jgi:hypothetical protein